MRSNKIHFRLIASITLTGSLSLTACSENVQDLRAVSSEEDSQAMQMPTGTNAMARLALPEELQSGLSHEATLIESKRSAPYPSDRDGPGPRHSQVRRGSVDHFERDNHTRVSLNCAAPVPPVNRLDMGAPAETSPIRHQVQVLAHLLEVDASKPESSWRIIAGLHKPIACRAPVLSLQNLPPNKNLKLRIAVLKDGGTQYKGISDSFKFNGTDAINISVKLKRDVPPPPQAVINVELVE